LSKLSYKPPFWAIVGDRTTDFNSYPEEAIPKERTFLVTENGFMLKLGQFMHLSQFFPPFAKL